MLFRNSKLPSSDFRRDCQGFLQGLDFLLLASTALLPVHTSVNAERLELIKLILCLFEHLLRILELALVLDEIGLCAFFLVFFLCLVDGALEIALDDLE